MGQGGLILLVNKTPYAWKKTGSHDHDMNPFASNLPDIVLPGDVTKVYVEWKSGPHNNDSAGEVFYELAETGGLKFQVWARGRKRSNQNAEEGLSIYLENLEIGPQPKRSWLNLGWQHDGYVGFVLDGNVHSFYSSAISANPKWMSFVDGDKKLSSLTIPGTHDTCTYRNYVTHFARCQDRDVSAQLNMGIRFLDIRLKIKDNPGKLYIYHGTAWTHVEFGDVLQTCYDFLHSNPSETIIMSIKHENNAAANDDFDKLLNAFIQNEDKAHYWHTGVQIPRLHEVRGKIVLFRRYALSSATPGGKFGIEASPSHWRDNMPFTFTNDDGIFFDIQDEYNHFHAAIVRKKFEKYVRDSLDTAKGNESSDTVFVNFTSAAGGLYPRSIATGYMMVGVFYGTNLLFSNWLEENKGNQRLGIIPMDFPEYPNNGVLSSQLVYRNDFNRYETELRNGCVYEIHALQAPGSALNVDYGLKNPGTPVILFHSTGGRNTQWKLESATGSNVLQILRPQNAPELVLAVKDAQTANQAPTVISEYKNEASQKWSIAAKSKGGTFFTIKPGHAGSKALELYGCNVADRTPVTLYDFNGSPAQIWTFLMVGFAPDGIYAISHRCAPQKCLSRHSQHETASDLVYPELQPRGRSANQQWKLVPVQREQGWYYIATPGDPEQVLDVKEGKTNDRAVTIIHRKNGGDNQKWRIESSGNGYFTVIPKHAPRKVLELYASNSANGTQPSLYTGNGSVAQHWILRPL